MCNSALARQCWNVKGIAVVQCTLYLCNCVSLWYFVFHTNAVRQKAKEILSFIQDDERLREARKAAKKSRDKYVGYSSEEMYSRYSEFLALDHVVLLAACIFTHTHARTHTHTHTHTHPCTHARTYTHTHTHTHTECGDCYVGYSHSGSVQAAA